MAFRDGGLPPGVILAGGTGRRMGGADKALLDLRGRPLLSHVAARLAPQVSRLALNANGDPGRFAGFGLPVLPDPLADAGPLAGVLAALDWAAGQGAVRVVTVAVDTPFFPEDLVRRFLAEAGTGPAIAASARSHPTFGLWPVRLRASLAATLDSGERRLGLWAQRTGAAKVVWETDGPDPFLNVNTPEDLAAAEARPA